MGNRGWRVTPIGIVLVVVLVVAVLLGIVGSKGLQVGGFVAAAVIVVLLLSSSLSFGMRGTRAKGLDERRAEFHAAHRGGNDDDLSEAEREQLWQREKERYDAKNQPE